MAWPADPSNRDAFDAGAQKQHAAWLRIYGGPTPGEYGTTSQAAFDTWCQNIHARVSSQQEQEPAADATADVLAAEIASRLRAPPRATRIPLARPMAEEYQERGTELKRY